MRTFSPLFFMACISFIGIPMGARADNFISAHYDAHTDDLVVSMRYRGTNPNHGFTVQWGRCEHRGTKSPTQQIAATVLDDQWNDAARMPFKKTVRFSLTDIACRPAAVTLRVAPRFRYTVNIPKAPASGK